MFLEESLADKINKETKIKEVYTEPDEVQNFLPEFEVFTWEKKVAIRVYPDGKYEIGKYDNEDDEYYY